MKMNRFLLLSLLFLGNILVTLAQNKTTAEADFYFNSEKYCEGAEKCTAAYTKLSSKGAKAKKDKGDMAFKAAECYRMTDRFKEANEWYERALLLDYQEVKPEIYYLNAEMLRMMGEFEKALSNYEAYQKLVPADKKTENGIRSCKESKTFMSNRTRHIIVNQLALNKKEFDMAPAFGDGKETQLFFGSSRAGSTGNSIDPISCQNYMDIWVSEIDKKGNWGEPRLADVTGKINTEAHEGTVCFDGRKKVMFFTRCPNIKKQNLGCDIWMSVAEGKGQWGEPQKLNLKNDADSITVGHPCITDDGKYLIFVSDMPGGYGGRDLWFVSFDKKSNTWSAPKNLGPEINTLGNELFPTLGKDGALFFATDGMPGLGGLDIFKATKGAGEMQWENPRNLGYPLNSENNDYHLCEISAKKGYFTSERKDPNGRYNPDIYMYEIPPNLYDLKVIVSELGNKAAKIEGVKVAVKGTDGSSWEGITGKSGSVFWDKKATEERYVNGELSYNITISKEGYLEDKKGSQFTTVGINYDQSFIIEMSLLPKKPIRLPEVRYPYDQWTLLTDANINSPDSLLFVYNLLQEFPGMVLELSSHTDARGKDEANQNLSENRARACYKYLVEQKGVDPRRIVPVGKGEKEPRTVYKKGSDYLATQPSDMSDVQTIVLKEEYINQFKTSDPKLFETLHQLNRRTEGRVITLDFDPKTAPAANAAYLNFIKYK
jgi:peptidoglycan-associated lipoprotein